MNIHPTKSEIKFENEQVIWQILFAAVKETLGKFSAVPTIEFDTEGDIEIPVGNTDDVEMPEIEFDPNYNPFAPQSASAPQQQPTTQRRASAIGGDGFQTQRRVVDSQLNNWDKLYQNFEKKRSDSLEHVVAASALNRRKPPDLSLSARESKIHAILVYTAEEQIYSRARRQRHNAYRPT